MNIEFRELPLSALLPVPKTPSPDGKLPQLWIYGSLWDPSTWPMSLENVDRFIAEGWVQTSASPAALESQLYQTARLVIDEEHQKLQMWYKPDKDGREPLPVVMAFSIENNPVPQNIPMLNPFPPPQFGEYAFVEEKDETLVTYHIMGMPPHVRSRWGMLGEMFRLCSAPLLWPAFTERIIVASNEQRYWNKLHSLSAQSKLALEPAKSELLMAEIALRAARMHYENLQNALAKPNLEELWQNAQSMARDLAKDYWEWHQSQQPPKPAQEDQQRDQQTTTTRREGLPAIPHAFDTGAASIITAMPIQGYLAAVSNAQEGAYAWQDEQGIPTFPYIKDSGRTHIQIRPDERASIAPEMAEKLWAEVKRLSDLDGDIFLAMLAQLINGPKDERGYVWIHAPQILDYRGIQPIKKKSDSGKVYRAGHRQEDILAVSHAIARFQNTWVKVDQVIIDNDDPGKGKQRTKRRVQFTKEDRLFNMGSVIRAHELDFDQPDRAIYAVAWQYQEADWLVPFTKGANRYIGYLAKKVLEYDPYHEFWEKRLARYFMIHLRINASYGGMIKRKIRDLIQELSLPIDERHPERTKQRFEKAMRRLVTDTQIELWQYEQNGQLPSKKWLETWLDREVVITATPAVQDAYISIKQHAQQRTQIDAPKKAAKQPRKGRHTSGRKRR
jgi:hypothetical protein